MRSTDFIFLSLLSQYHHSLLYHHSSLYLAPSRNFKIKFHKKTLVWYVINLSQLILRRFLNLSVLIVLNQTVVLLLDLSDNKWINNLSVPKSKKLRAGKLEWNLLVFINFSIVPYRNVFKVNTENTRTRFYDYILVTFYTFSILFLIFGLVILTWIADKSSVLNLFTSENKASLFSNIPLYIMPTTTYQKWLGLWNFLHGK